MSWEKSVIATAIASPSAMAEAEELRPSDFADPSHQVVWAEIMALHSRGALEARALVEALRGSRNWAMLGSGSQSPEDFLAQLANFRGSAMREYAGHVLSASIRRALQRSAALIAAEAADERVAMQELLDNAEKRILSLRRDRSAEEGISLADLYGVFLPRFEAQRAGSYRPAWTPEVQAVRNVIGFAEDSEYMIFAARPGQGKSSYIRYETFFNAVVNGRPSAIWNVDNDNMDYARAFLSLYLHYHKGLRIENTELKNPRRLSEEQAEVVRSAIGELVQKPLYLVDAAGWNVDRITRSMRKYRAEKHITLGAVDYIQLIYNGIENRVQDVGYSSGMLRNTGKQLGIPLMIAAQLSREIEKRGRDSEPELADLRESGTLEQDGTIIGFPRTVWNAPTADQLRIFPENCDARGQASSMPKAIPVRIYFKKNRNGPAMPTEPIKWDRSTGIFQTLTSGTRL